MNIRSVMIRTVIALALGAAASQTTEVQTAAACGEIAEEREARLLEQAVATLLGPARGAARISEIYRDPANVHHVRLKLTYFTIGAGNIDADPSWRYVWLVRSNATSEWTYERNGAGSSGSYVPPRPRTPAAAVKAALKEQTHGFASAIDIGEVIFDRSQRAAVAIVAYYVESG
jgi:hypothetical protein